MVRKQEIREKRKAGSQEEEVERGRERKVTTARQKPSGRRVAPRKGAKSGNRVIRYFQDTGDELRKVTWPTRRQALRLTLIVLGTTLAFMIFLGLLDLLFHQLASLLV